MKTIAFALAATAALSATSANAAPEIVRHANPPSIILSGVTIPPGSETLMLSGLTPTPIDPAKTDGFEAFGDTKTQAISVFERIKKTLAAQGYAMSDVVKLTVFVVGDPKLGGKMDFDGFNAAYKQYFGTADNPNLIARSTIQIAALANPWYLIEIEATAAKAPK